MAWSLYVLRCSDDSLYTGVTTDVARRLFRHAKGKAAKYTRSRLPVRLERSWPVGSRSEALKLEHRVKKLSRQRKERLLLCDDLRAFLS